MGIVRPHRSCGREWKGEEKAKKKYPENEISVPNDRYPSLLDQRLLIPTSIGWYETEHRTDRNDRSLMTSKSTPSKTTSYFRVQSLCLSNDKSFHQFMIHSYQTKRPNEVVKRIRSIISKRFMPALCSYRVSVLYSLSRGYLSTWFQPSAPNDVA